VVLVERVVVVRHQILVVVLLHLEQQIQVVAEGVHTLELLEQVALALLSCLYQQSTTQAQQLAHRQSRQAVHIQF
jgi:hypothetical protein